MDAQESLISNKDLPIAIIPQPLEIERTEGIFRLAYNMRVSCLKNKKPKWRAVERSINNEIDQIFSHFSINSIDRASILLEQSDKIEHQYGYELEVTQEAIFIRARTAQGAFYGYQTLKQLIGPIFFQTTDLKSIMWRIPCVKIKDEPRFPYRGMHLDVCRHFFEVDEVKRYIDLLAMHKMNTLHWHLTEDQGWRIEIKQYPKLTEVGAYRDQTLVGHYNDQPHQFDGKRYGGFYTQEQVKDIVAYAAERFITVIPEIELPGHAQAAIAAYPALGCTGEQLEVMQKWGISENVYCPTEETFTFLENVLTEVMDLFPSKYIHIGGDECPKTQWTNSAFCQQLMKEEGLKDEHELQSYFIRRIEQFINGKGRQIIGWDEILEGGLAPNATVMSWRGTKGGIKAAKSGHDVIMTPTSNWYLDYYQSDHPDEPLAIGGFLPLQKVYEYEPIPKNLTEDEAQHILGTQGNVWTEYIPTFEQVEYMAFPRGSALAEIGWSAKKDKDFNNFTKRLMHHYKRFDALNINAANHFYEIKSSIQPIGGGTEVILETLATDVDIHYTTDGTAPTQNSPKYESPIVIQSNIEIKAQVFVDGEKKGRGWSQSFDMHKAAGKTITLTNSPHPKYAGGGNGSIINGVLGSNERYGDAEWLGFNGENFEAMISFSGPADISKITFRFFNGEGQWIYLPKKVSIHYSTNGRSYKVIAEHTVEKTDGKVVTVPVVFDKIKVNFIKISVENFGEIPEGKQGAGNRAWLFVDEIIVE